MPKDYAGSLRESAVMTTHEFRILVRDPITEGDADRLFRSMDDGPEVETGPKAHAVGFDREGNDLLVLLLDALAQVIEAGLEPVAVEDEYVSASEIAERTGRSRQSISQLVAGDRGPGGFPLPAAGNVRSRLWRWADVAHWFERLDGRISPADERSRIIAGLNGALALRAMAQQRPRDAERITRQLVG